MSTCARDWRTSRTKQRWLKEKKNRLFQKARKYTKRREQMPEEMITRDTAEAVMKNIRGIPFLIQVSYKLNNSVHNWFLGHSILDGDLLLPEHHERPWRWNCQNIRDSHCPCLPVDSWLWQWTKHNHAHPNPQTFPKLRRGAVACSRGEMAQWTAPAFHGTWKPALLGVPLQRGVSPSWFHEQYGCASPWILQIWQHQTPALVILSSLYW